MDMQAILAQGGVSIQNYTGSSLGTSSTQISLGNSAKAGIIKNPNTDRTKILSYSLDDSKWIEIPPLTFRNIYKPFDALYLKSGAAGSKYDIETAEYL